MSARRELAALWLRCDSLRERVGPPGGEASPDARRLLDALSDELASALRRLVSAGALTTAQARDLEEARGGLAAGRRGGLSPGTAVAGCAVALQRVAAGLHISLVSRGAEMVEAVAPAQGNGTAAPEPAGAGAVSVPAAAERPAWSWGGTAAHASG
jgi:hypothetical protein